MLATVLFKFTEPLGAVMPVGFEVVVRIAADVRTGMSACRVLLPMWRSVQPLAARAVCMDWLDAATALFGFMSGGPAR